MKKLVFVLIICLFLIGCGKVEKKNIKEKNIEKYSLVSSKERLVFKNNNNYEIVYYENDKIIKVESAIKFDSAAAAKRHYLEESYGNNGTINYIDDVFIVLQDSDYWEDYKDLNKEELKDYLSNANYTYVLGD